MDAQLADLLAQRLRAGDKAGARSLLADALRRAPRDEEAWLALARLVDDRARKRDCLARALAINPSNEAARRLLARLEQPPPAPEGAAVPQPLITGPPPAPESRPYPRPEPPASAAPPPAPIARPAGSPAAARLAPRVPKWVLPAAASVCLVSLVCLALGAWWASAQSAAELPLPTALPAVQGSTATPYPTFPPAWTVTPAIATLTPTIRPTLTPWRRTDEPPPATQGPAAAAPSRHIDYWLAYALWDGEKSQVFVTDGTGPGVAVADEGGASDKPAWLADGRSLAFMGNDAANQPSNRQPNLYLADVSGGNVRQVAVGFSVYSGPRLSPDGQRLAFVTDEDRVLRLEVTNLDGSGRETLLSMSSIDASMELGDWSPDSRQIVFTTAQCETHGTSPVVTLCDSEVFAVEADGSNLRQLTYDALGAYGPRWSPDGSEIIFFVSSPDEWTPIWGQLIIMNADGSNRRLLVLDGVADINFYWPDWSPDGRHVAFQGFNADASGLYVVPVACFATPLSCAWNDVTRLPLDATGLRGLAWKYAPAIGGEAGEPPPTIPAATPLVTQGNPWQDLGYFAGRNTTHTETLPLGQGILRVTWQYQGPADSKFVIALSRTSTQEVFILDGTYGSGSGVTEFYVLFPGSDYFFFVESLGDWRFDLAFKPDG